MHSIINVVVGYGQLNKNLSAVPYGMYYAYCVARRHNAEGVRYLVEKFNTVHANYVFYFK